MRRASGGERDQPRSGESKRDGGGQQRGRVQQRGRCSSGGGDSSGGGGSRGRGRQQWAGETATVGGSERRSITTGEKRWETGVGGRWNLLSARQKQRNGKKGTEDDSRGNQLRGAWRQIRLEMTPPSSVNGPPLTASQIQCIRQIDTETAQSSGSLVFSDTVLSVGCDPALLLRPTTVLQFFFCQENNVSCLLQYHVPIFFNFGGDRYGLVTAAFPAAIWSKKEEHTARPGRTRPKHHFF